MSWLKTRELYKLGGQLSSPDFLKIIIDASPAKKNQSFHAKHLSKDRCIVIKDIRMTTDDDQR